MAVMKIFLIMLIAGSLQSEFIENSSITGRKRTLEMLKSVESDDDFIKIFNVKSEDVLGYGSMARKETYAGLSPTTLKCSDGLPQTKSIPVLNTNPQEYDYYPPCITAYRCGGCCLPATVFECVGVKVVNKTANVYRIKLSDQSYALHTEEYVDHTECGCQCIKTASVCSSKQMFDPVNCSCKCKFAPSACSTDKQWSSIYCGCICKHVKQCNGNFQWNPDSCKCECPIQNCPFGNIVDPNNCACVKT